jgi:DNA-binding MarR family transcriptional regulator
VVLKRIGEHEGLNQREVAKRTYKDPASVARILDILEKQNLIERKAVAGDRRTHALHLTADGEKMIAKITPIAKKIRAKGLTNISAEEHDQFRKTLDKIFDNFR